MTTEERLLKLENAFSTLAQLAANQDERTSALTQLAARQDTRTADTERSIRLLLELAQVQSSRIDDKDEQGRQFEAHLNVLGQRMTELSKVQTELAQAHVETERALSALTTRVDHLSETVERYISEGRNGKS
jgi:hypothetical protein